MTISISNVSVLSADGSEKSLGDYAGSVPVALITQRRGNIGKGKLYGDEAEFLADVEVWEREKQVRKEKVTERERAQEQLQQWIEEEMRSGLEEMELATCAAWPHPGARRPRWPRPSLTADDACRSCRRWRWRLCGAV